MESLTIQRKKLWREYGWFLYIHFVYLFVLFMFTFHRQEFVAATAVSEHADDWLHKCPDAKHTTPTATTTATKNAVNAADANEPYVFLVFVSSSIKIKQMCMMERLLATFPPCVSKPPGYVFDLISSVFSCSIAYNISILFT